MAPRRPLSVSDQCGNFLDLLRIRPLNGGDIRTVMDQALWRVDVDEGTERGDVEDYHCTREVLPLDPALGRTSDKDGLGEQDEESHDYELKEILVIVSWKNAGGVDKEIRLSSARLMEKF